MAYKDFVSNEWTEFGDVVCDECRRSVPVRSTVNISTVVGDDYFAAPVYITLCVTCLESLRRKSSFFLADLIAREAKKVLG